MKKTSKRTPRKTPEPTASRATPRPRPASGAAAALLVACLWGSILAAQAPPQPPPSPVQARGAAPPRPRETLFSLTVKGGWLMIPIGLCSVIVLTMAIERTISLRRSRVGTGAILAELFDALPPRARITREHVASALARCDAEGSIVSRVLRPGVEKIQRDEAHVQEFLREEAAKELHLLKRKLRPFSISASLAPLLGLLGTIFGMITCFENASAVDAASRAESLARGIYEALVTTAAGLCVAIPAMALYHYYSGRVDRVADLVEETATSFLDHYYGSTAAARPGRAPAGAGAAPHPSGREIEGSHVAAAAPEGAAGAAG